MPTNLQHLEMQNAEIKTKLQCHDVFLKDINTILPPPTPISGTLPIFTGRAAPITTSSTDNGPDTTFSTNSCPATSPSSNPYTSPSSTPISNATDYYITTTCSTISYSSNLSIPNTSNSTNHNRHISYD